ncbi:MFS transporter [Bdellovibrio bacteriovorus]|uniref:MFS transporter n=1 Tax=Bdellovibrio bacteriovorus TaxID=959 RepID=A0A150WVT2_BDEBC|nr:MFS transporter [Bdellovibrio bacteriovorus]KYG70638.1 MFS transporter [Bdellovibrio bacteriovorus]
MEKRIEPFTGYQKFVVALLAFLQFTIILDFMIVSPLGAVLMPALKITPAQFGIVVSGYAFSAGVSGFLAAGFADRFDRKKLLLFFYTGFVLGTLMCGLVNTFEWLVAARLITGIFGGVIGSIVFAIITDLFPMEKRGRVMGFVQTAFAASQILGLPAGLYFSNLWGWKAPFIMIVVVSVIAGIGIFAYLKPINEHLKIQTDRSPVAHLVSTVATPKYLMAFAATALLSIGGFMLMPFGTAFTVNNLGIHQDQLPMIYLISGFASILIGPMVGRACDMFGNFKVFLFGTIIGIIMVGIYTHLGITPLGLVILVNVLMFVGIFSRMIPSQTLMSGIPSASNRGAFMSVGSSIQQVAGGFASIVAGLIVVEGPRGVLEHYDVVGYVVIASSLVTLFMMWLIAKSLKGDAYAAK